jgi:hypothetical protein
MLGKCGKRIVKPAVIVLVVMLGLDHPGLKSQKNDRLSSNHSMSVF